MCVCAEVGGGSNGGRGGEIGQSNTCVCVC